MSKIQYIPIGHYTLAKGKRIMIQLSYQVFGKKLGTAPIIMVNHALTGNSNLAGPTGWWKDIVGAHKSINTQQYSVIAFNIPGNGFDDCLIEDYHYFIARDVAALFLKGLNFLKIKKLHALIGGSLGGGIAWEMAILDPTITSLLIPVATDWKATDWIIANCMIQEQLLLNSNKPIHDARMHAMLCYRTPSSLNNRFQRSKNMDIELYNVESWLLHHGRKLQERFQLSAYKLMNHLIKTIGASIDNDSNMKELEKIQAHIHIIAIDSDRYFTAAENKDTHRLLSLTHPHVNYHEIKSIHGHDAFLIEYTQLAKIISGILAS